MAIVILQHGPTAGAMRLGVTLRDYGHRLRVIDLHAGEPVPRNLDDTDGIISTGGPMSANAANSWIEPELELLAIRRLGIRVPPGVPPRPVKKGLRRVTTNGPSDAWEPFWEPFSALRSQSRQRDRSKAS